MTDEERIKLIRNIGYETITTPEHDKNVWFLLSQYDKLKQEKNTMNNTLRNLRDDMEVVYGQAHNLSKETLVKAVGQVIKTLDANAFQESVLKDLKGGD